jgi:hypothetical protein
MEHKDDSVLCDTSDRGFLLFNFDFLSDHPLNLPKIILLFRGMLNQQPAFRSHIFHQGLKNPGFFFQFYQLAAFVEAGTIGFIDAGVSLRFELMIGRIQVAAKFPGQLMQGSNVLSGDLFQGNRVRQFGRKADLVDIDPDPHNRPFPCA